MSCIFIYFYFEKMIGILLMKSKLGFNESYQIWDQRSNHRSKYIFKFAKFASELKEEFSLSLSLPWAHRLQIEEDSKFLVTIINVHIIQDIKHLSSNINTFFFIMLKKISRKSCL